jgi:glycosyltransferase involved in cell wall biosynthesis
VASALPRLSNLSDISLSLRHSALPLDSAASVSQKPSTGISTILLAICPVPPWPAQDGMALRASSLLRELAPRWPIVLVRPEGGESAAENGVSLVAEISVKRLGQWMYLPTQYDVRPMVNSVTEAVERFRPDVALFWGGMEYLHAAVRDMPVSVSDRVDCMTLSAWRGLRHARHYAELRERFAHLAHVFRYEYRMRNESVATVVVGETDARVLRRVVRVGNVHVVPNGVDIPDVSVVRRAARPTVMFTGVMTYQPNVDAVLYFAEKVWPSVHARVDGSVFQIVGRSPAPEIKALTSQPGIEVLADVRSVQELLAAAWVAVAPMRTGAGIKNKILEAWSAGTPVAMTPIATNGLGQAPPQLLLTADGAALADLLTDLLRDATRRQALGDLARETARNSFSWESKGAAFDQLLREASGKSNIRETVAIS